MVFWITEFESKYTKAEGFYCSLITKKKNLLSILQKYQLKNFENEKKIIKPQSSFSNI